MAETPTIGVWSPISSAPRDGTSVILFAEVWEYTHGTVQVGYFDDRDGADGTWHVADMILDDNEPDFDPEADEDDEDDYDFAVMDGGRNVGPTHWMPLPQPPARSDA